MKITKLKKGYRINLTDTEMSLLRSIHSEGFFMCQEIHDEDTSGLNPAEKRIMTEINNGKREWI